MDGHLAPHALESIGRIAATRRRRSLDTLATAVPDLAPNAALGGTRATRASARRSIVWRRADSSSGSRRPRSGQGVGAPGSTAGERAGHWTSVLAATKADQARVSCLALDTRQPSAMPNTDPATRPPSASADRHRAGFGVDRARCATSGYRACVSGRLLIDRVRAVVANDARRRRCGARSTAIG
jgi:hypothetical protein